MYPYGEDENWHISYHVWPTMEEGDKKAKPRMCLIDMERMTFSDGQKPKESST